MSENNKKIYQNVAALVLFIIFMAIITFVMRRALPTWAYTAMMIMGIVLCVVFSYRTIIYCAKLKSEKDK